MYQRIMVPLDGSELAECVLPHVEAIAKGCQVKEVAFVRVAESIDDPKDAYSFVIPEEDKKRIEEGIIASAEKYLKEVTERDIFKGVNTSSKLIKGGAVADILADYAKKINADLIIIATHGQSGISRWIFGSVADRVLHSSAVPVFMVRAPGCKPVP